MPFVEALRPHQWVKNPLVLFPLFFTNQAFELAGWIAAATAFVALLRRRSTC